MTATFTEQAASLEDLLAQLDHLIESDSFTTQEGETALALRAITW